MKIPASNSHIPPSDISAARNRKHTETGGLPLTLQLKLEARVMLAVNIDISYKLINGQMGTVKYFKYDKNNTISKIYVKFDDENAGKNMTASDRLAKENNWVPIVRTDTLIKIKQHNFNSPAIRRTQFPLTLAWACTVHKVQGLSLEKAVISFQLHKQRCFKAGQMYVALSRVKSMDGLFLTGSYNRTAVKVSANASKEYERLHKELPFEPLQTSITTPSNFVFVLLNCRSLRRHAIDLANDSELANCDVAFFTETQIYPEEDTRVIQANLSIYDNIEFNSCAYKFSSLAVCYKNSVELLLHEKHDGVSFIEIRKSTFSSAHIRVALIYRINGSSIQNFYEKIGQLVNFKNFDFIMGDFNLNALDPQINTLLCQILGDYCLLLKEATHLSGSLIDHVYVNKCWLQIHSVKCYVKSVYFSDHDAIKVVVTKNV